MSWPRTGLNDVVTNSTFIQCSLVDWQAVAIQLHNCSSEVTHNGDCADSRSHTAFTTTSQLI